MRIIDFITDNTDRHLGNFGFIYDVDSLKFIGPAPIFDNGTSLFGDCVEIPSIQEEDLENSAKQLMSKIRHPEKVSFDLKNVSDVKDMIIDIYTTSSFSTDKASKLADLVYRKLVIVQAELEKQIEKDLQKEEELER